MTALLASFSTAMLIGLLVWLARNLITTRLVASVKHEFDEKLEAVQANFRLAEERLRADLRGKDAEIASLRAGALAALANRQSAIDKRRLEAIDQLWAGVTRMARAKAATFFVGILKFEEASRKAAEDPKFRKVFEAIPTDMGHIEQREEVMARPFVSPMAWALFSAYSAIIVSAVLKLKLLSSGAASPEVFDESALLKIVEAALPHRAEWLRETKGSGIHHLLTELEDRLIEEFRAMMAGREADLATVQNSAAIVRAADELRATATATAGG